MESQNDDGDNASDIAFVVGEDRVRDVEVQFEGIESASENDHRRDGLMGTGATTSVAPVPILFPTGEELGDQNEFWFPSSSPVGNESRDITDNQELSLPPMDPGTYPGVRYLSDSRADMALLEQIIYEAKIESLLNPEIEETMTDSRETEVSFADTSTTAPIDNAEESPNTDTSRESPKEAMKNLLQKTFAPFFNIELLPEEDLERLAKAMVSMEDRNQHFFVRLYRELCRLYGDLSPDYIRPLVELLESQCGVPTSSGEEQDTVFQDKSVKPKSNRPELYKCSVCGEPKVTWKNGVRIPHGNCSKQTHDKETDNPDHDIDRVLKDPPKDYTVKYAQSWIDGKPAASTRMTFPSLIQAGALGYCMSVSASGPNPKRTKVANENEASLEASLESEALQSQPENWDSLSKVEDAKPPWQPEGNGKGKDDGKPQSCFSLDVL